MHGENRRGARDKTCARVRPWVSQFRAVHICHRHERLHLGLGEIAYYTSAVCIVMRQETKMQRFFRQHTDDITAMAVHPNGSVVVSGRWGGNPHLRMGLWSCAMEHESGCQPDVEGQEYPLKETQPLGTLMLHSRGICALDFSGDGKLLCSVGTDDYMSWEYGTGNGESS